MSCAAFHSCEIERRRTKRGGGCVGGGCDVRRWVLSLWCPRCNGKGEEEDVVGEGLMAIVREREMKCAPSPTDGFGVEVGGDLVVSEGRWSWTIMEGVSD
ncbi:hypothetical protein ACFE04_006182 [Oxalis oulophora]